MIDRIERRWRRLRRRASRSEMEARWLKLSPEERDEPTPGIVMIQIDGLARPQMERALAEGNLPFLKRLIEKEHCKLLSHYSGVPSTTPSVQGELFYGVRQAVPSFSFRDHETGEITWMLDAAVASKVEARLAAQGEGLLEGGSDYSNIYAGGAKESHFCASTWGWRWLKKMADPRALLGFAVSHWWSGVRIAALLVLELVLAIADIIRGGAKARPLLSEFKFVATRVGICIMLREFIVIGAKIDIARGLPAIHLNLLGYDEQAHRRGPSSSFAHWSLKGIDDSIKRIWTAAHGSLRRHYEVWIYSDHGQQRVMPYPEECGEFVQEAIGRIFDQPTPAGGLGRAEKAGIQNERVGWIGLGRGKSAVEPSPGAPPEAKVKIAALGPVGHVYPAQALTPEEKETCAKRIVAEARVPMALAACEGTKAFAWTRDGRFLLPDDAAAVLGEDHPFLEEAAQDLARLCHHPDAGQIVISGWRKSVLPMSFPMESGAHGGPGPEETHGFALLPALAPVRVRERGYLRPEDLRHGALRALGRSAEPFYIMSRRDRPNGALRVMTYNVHSCVGMDGRISVERIARVIMESDPDVVALQELDVGRARTGGHDQAHAIAKLLEMSFHFHPALQVEEELYGDAILSRVPMRLIKAGGLPTVDRRKALEPRGALWVALDAGGVEVQLLNTHLGLRAEERRAQAAALLGEEWLGGNDWSGPLALCGDFNALPGMDAHKALCKTLRDAQRCLNGHRPQATWFTRLPLTRIDHIFVNEALGVEGIRAPRTRVARIASDHLPLVADLVVRKD